MTEVRPPFPHGAALPVLYLDSGLIVVDKPSGVVTVPGRGDTGPTALERVWKQLKDQEAKTEPAPRVLHRLDKGTSGVLAFARSPEAQAAFGRHFTERLAEKEYLLLVEGVPSWDRETCEAPLGPVRKKVGRWRVDSMGKPSETEFEVLERFRGFAWLRAKPHTGRTHQIRLHAKALGFPLAVDPFYGRKDPLFLSEIKRNFRSSSKRPERAWLDRLPLHAATLVWPKTDQTPGHRFQAEVPKELSRVLRDLAKYARA